MTRFNLSENMPFVAVHAGEYIKVELESRGMTQKELATLTGIQTSILNDIIRGRRNVTAEQSVLIGKAMEIDDTFFYDMQKKYDMDCARISKNVAEQLAAMKVWNVLKDMISVKYFKKIGVLTSDIKKNIEAIFQIFNVKNLEEMFVLREQEAQLVYYKKSEKLKTNIEDLFSWKYYSMFLSKKEKIDNVFNANNIDSLFTELNSIFEENSKTVERTKKACGKYGIKFVVSPKEGQVPVDGMSFVQDGTPTIVLTLRVDSIDNFAFSIMHELGHIMLHLSDSEKVFVSIADKEYDNKYEEEANAFARDRLIPSDLWKRFQTQTRDVSPYKIAPYISDFAKKINVNPQIILGRFTYETRNYRMRTKFEKIIN